MVKDLQLHYGFSKCTYDNVLFLYYLSIVHVASSSPSFTAYFTLRMYFYADSNNDLSHLDNAEKCPFILHRFLILLSYRITYIRFLFLSEVFLYWRKKNINCLLNRADLNREEESERAFFLKKRVKMKALFVEFMENHFVCWKSENLKLNCISSF